MTKALAILAFAAIGVILNPLALAAMAPGIHIIKTEINTRRK